MPRKKHIPRNQLTPRVEMPIPAWKIVNHILQEWIEKNQTATRQEIGTVYKHLHKFDKAAKMPEAQEVER